MASDSYNFDVQHVFDDIPHGALSTSSVLEQVPQVAHVELHSDIVEQSSLESREVVVVPRVSDTTISLSSSVAHRGVHDFSVDLVSSTSAREESPIQQFVAQDDEHSSPPIFPLPVETNLFTDLERLEHNDSLAIVTQVV